MPSPSPARRVPLRAALWAFVVAALALHSLFFWIAHSPAPRVLAGDEPMYLEGAKTLAAGQTWQYESLWPPFQPIFLAVVLKMSGESLLAVEIVQTLLLLLAAWLLADSTKALSGSSTAAWVAGGLMVLDPTLVGFTHFLWPEVFHLASLLGCGWILLRRGSSAAWCFGAGLLFAVTLCSKYLLWPLVIAALPVVLWLGLRRWPRRLGLFALGAALVFLSVYSNDRLQMKRYPVIESAAFNAWVGLNDTSRKDFVDPVVGAHYRRYAEISSVAERNHMVWSEIGQRLRDDGIPRTVARQAGRQYFRLFDKDTFVTDQLPDGTIGERGRKGFQDTPGPAAAVIRIGTYVSYGAVLVLGVLGVIVAPARARFTSRVLLACFAFTLLIFLVSHVKSRFRIQLLPVFFLHAGFAVTWLGARFGRVGEAELWSRRPSPIAWTVASFAAAALMFLAFGRGLVG